MDFFTERFNEILQFEDITQAELANNIGITRQCITDYKRGKSYPTIQTLSLICQTLGVSSDYLLGLEDDFGARTAAPSAPSPRSELFNEKLSEKEKALLEAFKNLLPETQDFLIKTAQSLSETDTAKTLK